MARRIFLDNPPGSNIPALNEYLAQRAAEEQEQYYLQGSRNRNESKDLGVNRKFSNDEIKSFKQHIEHNERQISKSIDKIADNLGIDRRYISSLIREGKSPIEAAGDKYIQDELSYIRSLKDMNGSLEYFIENGEEYAGQAYNCLATATANNPNKGHYVEGNQTFRANPGKYGWKEVSKKEIKPGGIIQLGSPVSHAVILDSNEGENMYVNYSPGTYPEYKKHINIETFNDPQWKNRYYYNFVGNSADSTRWTNEYNKRYRKLNGGVLNKKYSLKHGGIYIKPSHRGRFTALKERTGHSTSWFKEYGTPAQKKMATFALNAAKWKH